MPGPGEMVTNLFSNTYSQTQASVIWITEKPASQTRTWISGLPESSPFDFSYLRDPSVRAFRPVRLRLYSQILFFYIVSLSSHSDGIPRFHRHFRCGHSTALPSGALLPFGSSYQLGKRSRRARTLSGSPGQSRHS